MKRVLLVIAALLSLTVLLAACKKSGDTISTPTAESTPATVEATPAPTELPPYEANVLTGEPKGADYPEGQRITAEELAQWAGTISYEVLLGITRRVHRVWLHA